MSSFFSRIIRLEYVLSVIYVFLLVVLYPHTAWTFALLEPVETLYLANFAAIAFEITIAVLTHYFGRDLKKFADIENRWARMRAQFSTVPSVLLVASILISVVANWTHGYVFIHAPLTGASEYVGNAAFLDNSLVKFIYSMIFAAILPLCSFGYAYVLHYVYTERSEKKTDNADNSRLLSDTEEGMLRLINLLKASPGLRITPPELARLANIGEMAASDVIREAIIVGLIE